MALTQIGVVFEIDFTNTGTWVDVTQKVMQINQLDRGRQHELQRNEAGTLALTLDNSDDAFDPLNTLSPYYPNLKPGRPIRARATTPSAGGIFRGKIQNFPPTWEDQSFSEVVIQASDAFLDFQAATIDRAGYDEAVVADGATHYWKLDEAASNTDSTAKDSVGSLDVVAPLNRRPQFGVSSLLFDMTGASVGFSGASQLLKSSGRVGPDATFSIELVVSQIVGNEGLAIAQGSFYNAGSSSNAEFGIHLDDVNKRIVFDLWQSPFTEGGTQTPNGSVNLSDGLAHHIVCVHASGADRIYVDGLLITSTTASFHGVTQTVAGAFLGIGNDPGHPGTTGGAGSLGPLAFNGILTRVAYYGGVVLNGTQIATHATLALNPWTGDLDGARIDRVLDLIGWSPTLRAIDTGQSVMTGLRQEDISSSALDYIQKIEKSAGGNFFIDADGYAVYHDRTYKPKNRTSLGSFGDNYAGGEIPFLPGGVTLSPDDLDLWNSATVKRVGTDVGQTATNDASITEFGKKSIEGYDDSYLSDDEECLAQAQWLVDRFGTPVVRVESMEFKAQDSFTLAAPQVIARELDDAITISRHKMVGGGTAFSQVCAVEGIESQATPDEWYHTFRTNPFDTREYWILGTSALGSGTRLSW